MAVPVTSLSCCILNYNKFFYQELNDLAFKRDTCCQLVICLQLLLPIGTALTTNPEIAGSNPAGDQHPELSICDIGKITFHLMMEKYLRMLPKDEML
jgi:hypothetical protein